MTGTTDSNIDAKPGFYLSRSHFLILKFSILTSLEMMNYEDKIEKNKEKNMGVLSKMVHQKCSIIREKYER